MYELKIGTCFSPICFLFVIFPFVLELKGKYKRETGDVEEWRSGGEGDVENMYKKRHTK